MAEDYVVHIKGKDVEDSLKQPGPWIVANIVQAIGWPQEDMIVVYEGLDMHLLTYNDEHDLMPAIALRIANGLNNDEAKTKITNFLSALNWVSGGSIRIDGWIGGGRPVRSKDTKGTKYTATFFRITYIPSNLNENQKLALALLREGDGLRHTHYGYSFLSYFKIINLVKKNGEKQKKWIKNNIGDLKRDAKKRADELVNDGESIEEYLYHSCRCALAHAGVEPTINPDDVNDSARLYQDLPLISHLARHMIESHFSIKTDTTIYNEHLYELSGFKEILGEKQVEEIVNSDSIPRRSIVIDRKVSIRQWCDKRYGVFESLNLKTKRIQNGVVFFECANDDKSFKVELILDFKEERVFLEIEDAIINAQDEKTQIEYNIDWNRFFKDFLCNGQLEIFIENDNQFLGRKDANLPVNIDLGRTADNIEFTITQLQSRLDEIV